MRRSALFAIVISIFGLIGCDRREAAQKTSNSAGPGGPARPSIVFMTDFGTANDAVAICKAVMLRVAPDARILDITHQVTPFSIEEGARFLAGASPYYPEGTVFVVVIDPGVGTSRKAVVVKTKKGQFFVLPDNGLISPIVERDGLDSAREITNTRWMIGETVSSTFHGRDIFSPVGAHHPFGSLITDISGEEFKTLGYKLGDKVTVELNKKPFTAPYVKTFMDVPVGDPLLFVDSRGRVSLALNERNFSQVNKISPPVSLFIPKKGASLKGK